MASRCWNTDEIIVESPELSSHIRQLLLPYVQTHITTPYAQFTEMAVSNLLSDLKLVPIHDPASLILPADPLTVYLSNFISGVEPYVEKLQTTNEARLLIKRLLASKLPRVEKFPDDDEEKYKHPRSSTPPILTRRAIRETPVIGKKYEASKSYAEYSKISPHHPLCLVPVEDVSEPQVNFDQVLDVKHYIRAEDHAAVRSILKLAAKPAALTHTHGYLPASLADKLELLQQPISPPDSPPFMPIFPRRIPVCPPTREKRERDLCGRDTQSITGHKPGPTTQSIPESMQDVPMVIRPTLPIDGKSSEVDTLDNLDLSEENMLIVDGWRTLVTSSPSILSNNSDEEDQLFLPSSPDTDVGAVSLVKAVEDSKLEDVLMPRSRKVGGDPCKGDGKVRDSKVGRALSVGYGQFLAPLLRPKNFEKAIPNFTSNCEPRTPQSEPDLVSNSSMLGQASNLSDFYTNTDQYNDGDTCLRNLYGQMETTFATQKSKNAMCDQEESRGRETLPILPYSFIKDEPLFEDGDFGQDRIYGTNEKNKIEHDGQTSVGALFPVPNLPEPNTYITTNIRATTLAEYVIPTSGSVNDAENRPQRFLRKAKGVAGLRVALSWVPFTLSNTGDPLTHATVANVAEFGDAMEASQCDIKLVQNFLNHPTISETSPGDGEEFQGVSERLWAVLGDQDDREGIFSCESLEPLRYEIILTREERMGIMTRKNQKNREDNITGTKGKGSKEEPNEATIESDTDQNYSKRKMVDGRETSDNELPWYKKKRRLLDQGEFNDSGIGMSTLTHGSPDYIGMEGEMLDLDAEFDQEHEIGFPGDNHAEDEGLFEAGAEKENRPPTHKSQKHGPYLFGGNEHQETSAWEGGTSEWHGYYPRTENLSDYSREHPSYQCYDAPLDATIPPELDQDLLLGTNEILIDASGPFGYTHLPDGYMDLSEDHDNELLNDDQDNIGGSFEPLSLSFDSQNYQVASARSSQVQAPLDRLSTLSQTYSQNQISQVNDSTNKLTTDESQVTQARLGLITDPNTKTTDVNITTMVPTQLTSPRPSSSNSRPSPLGPLLDPSLATHTLGTASFAWLRGKTLKSNTLTDRTSNVDTPPESSSTILPPKSYDPPAGLYDRRTLSLPSGLRAPPVTAHKYLASLDLLQKWALVRALRSQEHQIDLVERVSLDGADLILDVHAALIFVPLLSLPAQTQAEALLERVSSLSKIFERLLVVFEAYPASRSVRAIRSSSSVAGSSPVHVHSTMYTTSEPGLYAYTPPVMKAIRKFRRDLDIAEACNTKSVDCLVEYAFADSVEQAASYSRMFGDILEAENSRGYDQLQDGDKQYQSLWDDRAWLDWGPDENEDGLAIIPGMNHFKAAVVLSQIKLKNLLALHPQERVEMFSGILGVRSVMAFNEEMERRLEALEGYEEEESLEPMIY